MPKVSARVCTLPKRFEFITFNSFYIHKTEKIIVPHELDYGGINADRTMK